MSVVCALCGDCMFIRFSRLDDYESKEDGSRSQPRSGCGDYSNQDEECYDVAQIGKPFLIISLPIFIKHFYLLLKKSAY
jgi:hypothetical protein